VIVELFGPPGVGKSTFACVLAAKLKEHGVAAELILSYRPAERVVSLNGCAIAGTVPRAVVIRRLARPALEMMLALARQPLVNAHDLMSAVSIVRKLPPKNVLNAVREVQYITRLSNSWHRASRAGHVVVFDQAYVQAIYSLASLSGVTDEALLAQTLELIPRPDLYVRLEAPLEILRERLDRRKCLQSTIERLFELTTQANRESIAIIDRLNNVLRERQQHVNCIASLDSWSLQQGAEMTVQQIIANIKQEHMG
jgi:thymidylate kinase